MRVRETNMQDYGFSEEEAQKLREYCRTARGLPQLLLLQSAQEVNEAIAGEIYTSLALGKSYDRLVKAGHYVPYGRVDFYAYQRKTLEAYRRWLALYHINWE